MAKKGSFREEDECEAETLNHQKKTEEEMFLKKPHSSRGGQEPNTSNKEQRHLSFCKKEL